MSQQEISAPDLRKYRTELPNLLDDMDLDPYAFRLLVHYYRVGNCWESTRTTAQRCQMSVGKVSETRRMLAQRGLIHLADEGSGTLKIHVRDIWPRNFAHFAEISRRKEKAKQSRAGRKPSATTAPSTMIQQAATFFEKHSHLMAPQQKKEWRQSWRLPLSEICALADGQPKKAEQIIERAYERLNKDGLTISSPRSILKTARAVAAELKSGAHPGGQESSQDWDRRIFGGRG